MKTMCENMQKEIDEIKTENEKLKEDIERRKQWRVNSIYTIKKLSDNAKAYIRAFNRSIQEINELRMENEELKEELELNTANAVVIEMAERLNKLQQALEDVREIATPHCSECLKIIDKINEVLK